MAYGTISEIREALRSGESALSITESYLKRIKEFQNLNAFIEIFEKDALRQAKDVDVKIANGTAGQLAGCVVAIKDNICFKGHRVTASSKILDGFESLFTATALQRLIDQDVIVIGRLNCDEFAMGSSNETSVYGPVKNNLDTSKVPGGSSGGSAVAASAGLCTFSLGSDTGGSIRQPASWTKTYGFKPTYGRISRYGLIAYASSFDQIGPFTNSLEDAELITEIMSGKDEFDSTSSSREWETNVQEKGQLAVISEYLHHPGLDNEVKEALFSTIEKLKKAGYSIKEYSFPFMEQLVPTYYVLSTAEASSNLARFDGVHYGYRSTEAKGVEETYTKSRTEGFGKEVKRRIMAGTFVLSHGYYDAYYAKAQQVRRLIKNKTIEILTDCDAILMPTTPGTAFALNAISDPIQMYLQDIFTVHANIAGNPALSMPWKTHSNGLPFGIQLMAADFNDQFVLNLAKKIEKQL
ncbi:MAG TPA: Asp-tRNA(Asn)/Glu-tRNA(Gln) amidotransferase GatCAB subunit A [Crocinitomicaceae bacterium]|nr:Asp-tRNA(Asn)/Glu-tRNA(Gln) amidotransferase GatCAB subunit A [Crocinitomicaceae bacterium]